MNSNDPPGIYHKKGIIIDSNILLLYFVGRYNKNLIPKFKRTSHFSKEDYDRLRAFLSKFPEITTTPNILTEVSNLVNHMVDKDKARFWQHFLQDIAILDEKYIPSKEIAKINELKIYGITDIGIYLLSKKEYLILTDDYKLSSYLIKNKIDVINFNHIRFLELE